MKQMRALSLNFIKSISLRSVLVILSALLFISTVSFTLIGFVVVKNVTVVDGGTSREIATARIYVDEMLAEQGIILRNGDKLSMPLRSVLRDGDKLIIKRGKAVTLTVDGTTQLLYTDAATLKDAFSEWNVVLGVLDEVDVALDAPVTEGMRVTVVRVNIIEKTEEVTVPRKVVERYKYNEMASYRNVLQEGSDGIDTVVSRVVLRDGVEVSREELSRAVTQKPVNQIVEKGVLTSVPVTANIEELNIKKVMQCTATAYTATPNGKGGFVERTASGRPAGYGVVAVDPRVIPLGTKLYIESLDGSWAYGYAVAGDTGGAIKGNIIDLFFNTYNECIQYGRRQIKVYVLA